MMKGGGGGTKRPQACVAHRVALRAHAPKSKAISFRRRVLVSLLCVIVIIIRGSVARAPSVLLLAAQTGGDGGLVKRVSGRRG